MDNRENMGSRDRLSRKTAHDLKNILATLIANVELLLDERTGNPREEERLTRMLKACDDGVRIVDSIQRLDEQHSDTLGVLLVDDEPAMLNLTRRNLESRGHRVFCCSSMAEAFSCFLDNPGGIDLLLTDLAIHGGKGKELVRELRAIRPKLPCILITGDDRSVLPGENPGCILLRKPVRRQELFSTIETLMHSLHISSYL